jgi:gluconolactonase
MRAALGGSQAQEKAASSGASPKDLKDYEFKVDKVSAGHKFTEGPAWSDDGYLIFSDVPSNKVLRFTPGKGTDVLREESGGANGNAVDAQGRILTCESRGRRLIRIDKSKKVEVLAESWEGKRLNAPNDVAVRKDGHIWFTDPAFGDQADRRELDFYGVYHLPPKGPLELVAKTQGRPNGVTLAPNGRTLYVADSDERLIRAWDVDSKGLATNERRAIQAIDGPPDGIRCDEKGNLWIAANQLAVYSAKGDLLRELKLAETPRNLAFGDPDGMSLYITAYTSVYRTRVPWSGAKA